MQTWYAQVRGWADWDEEPDEAWYPFGLGDDDQPIEFLGSSDDALRQLEDELRVVIAQSSSVERRDQELLLVTDDEDCGGQRFLEYRLIDRAASTTRRERKTLTVGGSGSVPPRFMDEFQDVAGMVPIDLDTTIADLDEEVGQVITDLLVQLITTGDQDPGEIIRNLMTAMLWLFVMGREHASRGYEAPLPATVVDTGHLKSSFWTEYEEIAGDVVVDYQKTLLDLDEAVGLRVNDFLVELFRLGSPDEGLIMRHLLSAALWMFRLGRAHADRGYSSPIPRGDAESSIPDTLDLFFDSES